MNLNELLAERVSIRGFLDKPVPRNLLCDIFTKAQLSPSNCNTQPWKVYVVSGEKKEALSKALVEEVLSGKRPNPDFNTVDKYEGVHRDRQFGSANALYGSMEVDRKDKAARLQASLRNWQFFDAPHVVFFTMEKYLDVTGAVDLGIYAQSLTLLLVDNGLASCMQGALNRFPDPARKLFGLSESEGILFGMSIGYPDPDVPANRTKTDRAELDAAIKFVD